MGNASDTLHALAARVWEHTLSRQPYFRMIEGLPVTQIPTETLDDAEGDVAFADAALEDLGGIDARALPYADLLTLEFMHSALTRQKTSTAFWWTQFPVTPYTVSVVSLYGRMLFAPFVFETSVDGERYVALANDFGRFIAGFQDRLVAMSGRGWRIPQPALPGVTATLGGLKTAVGAWLTVAPERLAALPAAAREQVSAGAANALQKSIGPAFDALIDYLSGDYAKAAPQAVGLAQFPGGEDAYRMLVNQHLTFDADPRQVHEVGLQEVARLTDEMRKVRESVGFTGGEREFVDMLLEKGRMHAKSAEEVEQTFRRHMARMEEAFPRYFLRKPEAPWAIARLPPAMEAGMSYGIYQPATPAVPVGIYNYNGSGLETRSQLQAAALIFHELLPGHHQHFSLQHENTGLPSIRRNPFDLTAFNEGWAEYASGLAGEMGLYDDPYDRYGRLMHERFTAQRLVVDPGLNLLGWSLEKARAYMAANTLESETQVAAETLRYSTDLPAQALAYRMGYLKFTELRARVAAKLGPRFDIREFHEAILGQGALPLAVLEKHLDRFAETGKA